MYIFRLILVLLLFLFVSAGANAQCSYSNPTECGSPGVNNIAVGGIINGGNGSSIVVTPSGGGSAQTLANITSRVSTLASPYAYGAKCDGSTDDSTAFAAAIAALPSGGSVVVPATGLGCIIATGQTLTAGVTLQGVGLSSYPGPASTVAQWVASGSWIICTDTVHPCMTESAPGVRIKLLPGQMTTFGVAQ